MVNVAASVRVLLLPRGPSGGGSSGGAGPGDSALSAARGLFLAGAAVLWSVYRERRGLAGTWRPYLPVLGQTPPLQSEPGRHPLAMGSGESGGRAGPGHTLSRVGLGGPPLVWAAVGGRSGSDLEETCSQCAGWSRWRGLQALGERGSPGLGVGPALWVPRDPTPLPSQPAARLTAALPFQGRAGR